jgi:putative SOS response-associated peptidase YedK
LPDECIFEAFILQSQLMCYNYEDMQHSIRKRWKHNHAGDDLPSIVGTTGETLEGSTENDTSMYPGRKGRILLLGEANMQEGFFGLLSPWNKKFSDAKVTFNARAETIAEKPTWRTPWNKKQRCLVETTGFYETDKSTKKKYLFTIKGETVFYYAGLFNYWNNPENGDKLLTYSIITTEPNDLVAQVHHRMPLIVDQDFKKSWMEEATPFHDLVKIMQPFPSHLMNMHEVVIEKKSKAAQSDLGF